jgi:hypothetical protein
MATAGYSGTPLMKKLGIAPETKLMTVNAPEDYFQLLEADVSSQMVGKPAVPDLVHLFVKDNKEFEAAMKNLEPLQKKNRNLVIWVSWHKKSAGIPTDLTEDVIRNYALKGELVDVKVCAVSDIWSGLKLVIRKEKR